MRDGEEMGSFPNKIEVSPFTELLQLVGGAKHDHHRSSTHRKWYCLSSSIEQRTLLTLKAGWLMESEQRAWQCKSYHRVTMDGLMLTLFILRARITNPGNSLRDLRITAVGQWRWEE